MFFKYWICTSIALTFPQVSQQAEACENSCKNTATNLSGATITDLQRIPVSSAVTPITMKASY